MVIKKFAKLCNCNPQTIRYYDSIGLLKPVRVDKFTGYRYYDAEQALQYLKIKKLQEASFSIEEIKELLELDDDIIYDALIKKVEEKEEELLKIKQIQKTYQKEMKEMKQKIETIKEDIMKTSANIDFKDQFNLDEEEFFEIIQDTNELLDNSLTEGNIRFEKADNEEFVLTDDFKLVYEFKEFEKVKDVLDSLPTLKGNNLIYIILKKEYHDNLAFISVLTSLLLQSLNPKTKTELHFEPSKDDKQYLRIYKKTRRK